MIGDNLSSLFNVEVIALLEKYGIKMVFLPANSTHLTQPIDIAVFRSLKYKWKAILEEWKMTSTGKSLAVVPKDVFPGLLDRLIQAMAPTAEDNIKSGFRKAGVVPFNPEEVLRLVPGDLLTLRPKRKRWKAVSNLFCVQ